MTWSASVKILVTRRKVPRWFDKTAAARIRKRRKGVTLGGLGIKDLINEGRR